MNVLIVTVLAPHSASGVISYYNRLAQDMENQGITVCVIDSSHTPFLWRKFLGIIRRIMPVFGSAGRASYEEFANFTAIYIAAIGKRKEKPDLIHAQDASSGAATYLAMGRKIPVVMSCHFNDDPASEIAARFSLGDWSRNRLTQWYTHLFSYTKNYVFSSNYVYNKSKHLLPVNVNKLIIYNTVSDTFTTVAENRDMSSKLTISNVGYFDERKNQKLLIQIADELRKRGITNFVIWLIGDGPKRAECEQLVNDLNLTGQAGLSHEIGKD